MNPTLPPETFRIRPKKRSRLYYIVHIAEDVHTLRRAMRKHAGWCHPDQLACVISATSPDLRGLIGAIYFPRTCLGAGLVAHELSHAAFRAMDIRGRRVEHWKYKGEEPDGKSFTTVTAEEEYCNIIEHLTRSFWNEVYRLGLAAPPPDAHVFLGEVVP